MRSIYSLLFLSLLAFSLADDDFPYDEDVMVLTDETFDSAVKKYDNLMVLFYAPWCGHCKKFHPEYRKAAITLKKEGLILAKCDATVAKKLSDRFKIQGFPTTKLFLKGNPIEYNGGRTEAEVVAWMRKKTGPATRPLNTVEEAEKFINSNEVALVYFGNDASQLEIYTKVATKNEDFPFATAEKEEVLKKYNAKEGSVVLFKNFDEKRNDLTEGLTEKNIEDFIAQHSSPKVMVFNDKAAQLIFGKNVPGIILYADPNSEKFQSYRDLMAKVAEKTKGIQVIVTGIKGGMAERLAEFIGIKDSDLPSVRIADTTVDFKKYNMEGEINEENILKFIQDWKDKKLTPSLKSEDEPTSNDGLVYKLVGKTFDRDVINNDNDVFVKFYAPWCGHCKALAPKYEQLAKKLKNNKKLVIAEMDATANEVESVNISGFPTLKLYAGGKKSKPIDYEGDKSLEDMEKFVKTHATNPVVIEEEKKEEKKDEKKTTDL